MRRAAQAVLRVIAVVVSASVLLSSGARAEYQTRHVVIVAIDGARYSETLGDTTLTYQPHIGRDLTAIGATPGTFWNNGVTVTVPGMTAMWSGCWQNLANDGSERPHLPTLAEYLRASTGDPDSEAFVVAGKTKLFVLGHSDHPSYGADYGAVEDVSFPSDLTTYDEVHARLFSRRPKLMLVNLGDTDVRGHSLDWPGYLWAIHNADSLVWQLWNDIEADTGLAGRTTLFVTNDHGRHDDQHGGFQNHGDNCFGCRRIELVMVGPDTRPGYAGYGSYDQRDIACTAGYLLGIPMPLATGGVMDELLIEPSVPLGVPGHGAAARRLALSAWPNPARGASQLTLAGAGGERAKVEILDPAGRRVTSLKRAGESGSSSAWSWDGRDQAGRPVPPGLYLARATTPSGVATARVVRVR